jgi:cytoskeleton protein RodZ
MTDSDRQASSGSAGARLASERRRHQLGITEVARRLNLSRTAIEDIEADRTDRIPAIYLRGYVTNYARALGLDPDPLLERIGADEPAPLRSVLPATDRGHRFDRFVRFATYLLVTTVIVPPLVYFFVLGGARLFESGVAARDSGDRAPAEAQQSGYRERVAEALAVKPLSAEDPGQKPISASTLPVPLGAGGGGRDAGADAAQSAGDEPEAETAGDVASELELELSADSWVEIESASGQRLEFDLLRAGARHRYRGEPPFRMLLGRGSAVKLRIDGEAVAFDGDDQAGVAEFIVDAPAPVPARPGATGEAD